MAAAAAGGAACCARLPLRRLRCERGQTLVEFAIALPLLVLLVYGIIEFGITYNHYLALSSAVRITARTAVVSASLPQPESVATAAGMGARDALDPTKLKFAYDPPNPTDWTPGTPVKVTGTYPCSIDIPFVKLATSGCTLSSSVTEQVE